MAAGAASPPFPSSSRPISEQTRRSMVRFTASRFSTTSNSSKDLGDGRPPANTPLPDAAEQAEPTLLERSNKNFLERLYDKYSLSQQTNRILMAESFLQAATSQASDPRWFGPGRIGRDFRSYQALLTMHIWFLHKRLINDNEDPHRAALIQEELFDIFWTDSSNRMRAHGVNEWLINKNLKTVQQYTFMHLFHYDHCYTGELLEEPKYRLEELKNLVKTHILLLSPDDETALNLHDDHAERIAWYIETQYQNIVHDMPDDFYRKARIAWVDLPSFEKMVDGNTGKELPEQPINPEDVLPKGWAKNIANDGTYYYWNIDTREAQWEHPAEGNKA